MSVQSKVILSKSQAFSEDAGVFFEGFGLTRMSGRIIGHLLLSKNPLSIGELVELVETSKSAISTALKELRNWNLVRQTVIKGSRRDYFYLEEEFGKNLIHHYTQQIHSFSKLADTASQLKRKTTPQLENLTALFKFLESGIPKIIDLWDQQNTSD